MPGVGTRVGDSVGAGVPLLLLLLLTVLVTLPPILSAGGLVVGFELLVALIPLHPYFYLLGIAPTAAAGVTAMQAYLKV